MDETQKAPPEVLAEVEKDFEATLAVPENKPKKQWMLMPVGRIGAGKTTVVKPLAKHFDLIRFSTDEVRKMLRERGYSYEGCREIINSLSRKYLNQGYSVVFDANTGSKHGVEYNAKTAVDFPGVPQIFIHINPPDEFIINKLRNYKHTWLFKDGEHAVSRYLAHKNDNPDPGNFDFVYEFDTSRSDLNDQIEEAIEVISKKLKE